MNSSGHERGSRAQCECVCMVLCSNIRPNRLLVSVSVSMQGRLTTFASFLVVSMAEPIRRRQACVFAVAFHNLRLRGSCGTVCTNDPIEIVIHRESHCILANALRLRLVTCTQCSASSCLSRSLRCQTPMPQITSLSMSLPKLH